MAEITASQVLGQDAGDKAKPSKSILTFPLNLRENQEKEYIRFSIVDRKALDERKSIYLFTPQGISVPDAASYNQVDLGILGAGTDAISNMLSSEEGVGGSGLGIADIISGATTAAIGKYGGAAGQAGLMKAGLTSNPYATVAFQGTTLRSFSFTFKMVPESEQEMEEARQIENTFRKFLYPKQHPASKLMLVYPPYWKIQFMNGEKENKFLPMIHLSYLTSMTGTYNSSGNAFHPDGGPTEIDISLTFQESKALTREDLYNNPEGYDDTLYHYDRKSTVSADPNMGGP